MRSLVFSGRNIKELIKDPLSWIFCVGMPVILFLIMQIVMIAVGAGDKVPVFQVDNFFCGILIFGFSFLGLFCATLIAKDRSTSFLQRMFASPAKPMEYLIGYLLPLLAIAAFQFILLFITAIFFNLTLTWGVLLLFVTLLPSLIIFIALGIILGSVLSDKSAPGVTSVVVQISAFLSGMWFDLKAIGGAFNIFCHVLPFANSYDVVKYSMQLDFGALWLPFLITFLYSVVLSVLACYIFKRKMKLA